jgi:hypothetical protein
VNDTSPDALDVQLACFAALPPKARLRKMAAAARRGRDFALAAIRRRDPGITEAEARLRFLALAYGDELAADVRDWLGARGR